MQRGFAMTSTSDGATTPPDLRGADCTDMRARVQELHDTTTTTTAAAGPSPAATQAQHDRGRLTARERMDILFDPDTFREIEQLRAHRAHGFGLERRRPASDGVVTGWGLVHERQVFA